MFWVMDMIMGRSSEEGARQFIWAALADNTEGRMRGAYCDTMRIVETSDYSVSQEGLVAQETLWVRTSLTHDRIGLFLTQSHPRAK